MSAKPTDPVPTYEELFEQRPQNTRTGYSHIPPTDPEIDLENQSHVHTHTHTHHSQEYIHPAQAQGSSSAQTSQGSIPAPVPQEHFHCETCDAQRERRENREMHQRQCTTVANTFIKLGLMLTLVMVIAIPTAASVLKKKH